MMPFLSFRLEEKHLLTSLTMSCMESFTRSQKTVPPAHLLKCMPSLNLKQLFCVYDATSFNVTLVCFLVPAHFYGS
jgi:hypothetical protein